jgi:hypothetical protein
MTREQIFERCSSGNVNSIFAFERGVKFIGYQKDGSLKVGKPVEILAKNLVPARYCNEEGFIYDLDCTFYKFSDYGETWAFSEEELNV